MSPADPTVPPPEGPRAGPGRSRDGSVRYDGDHPGFPGDLVADLAGLSGLAPGSRVLEIGCGTGRLSVPLARLGVSLLALEMVPGAAAVARRRLAGFPHAEVAVTTFERWRSTESFDAVVCPLAFGALDPARRLDLCADRLRLPGAGRIGGTLAVVDTRPVAGGDDLVLRELRECFGRWAPSTRCESVPPPEEDLPTSHPELSVTARFSSSVRSRRYVWERSSTAAEHLDLLRLRAGPDAPPGPVPVWLQDCFEAVVASRDSGRVTQQYATDLRVATRAR